MRSLILPILLALSACAAPSTETATIPAAAPANLDGDWRLVELLGNAPQTTSTLSVRGDKITGKAPCNSWFSNLVDDGVVLVSPIAATRMNCARLDEEQELLGAILSAQRAERTEDRLSLIDDGGRVVAVFAAQSAG